MLAAKDLLCAASIGGSGPSHAPTHMCGPVQCFPLANQKAVQANTDGSPGSCIRPVLYPRDLTSLGTGPTCALLTAHCSMLTTAVHKVPVYKSRHQLHFSSFTPSHSSTDWPLFTECTWR